MEVFEDFTVNKHEMPGYVMIPKREFNPELSAFSNLVLDFVDFKDRVRPMALDITRHDTTRKFQPKSLEDIQYEEELIRKAFDDEGFDLAGELSEKEDEGQRSLEDSGYSSLEIGERSGGDTDAAKPDFSASRDALDAEDEVTDQTGSEEGEDKKKEE